MRKIEIARLIASKIAYQLVGNVVNPSQWSSYWLHEGLATILGEEAVVKVFIKHSKTEILNTFILKFYPVFIS